VATASLRLVEGCSWRTARCIALTAPRRSRRSSGRITSPRRWRGRSTRGAGITPTCSPDHGGRARRPRPGSSRSR
jgi:hypothetical protein